MSEVKFSPGPWEIYEDDIDPHEVCIDSPSWGSLAKVVIRMEDEGLYDSTGIANAHLIAAAPELYETMEKVRESLGEAFGDMPSWMETEFEMMDAALAKARGETP